MKPEHAHSSPGWTTSITSLSRPERWSSIRNLQAILRQVVPGLRRACGVPSTRPNTRRQRWARAVRLTFMSGTAAIRPLPGAAVSTASCAAVEGLARALAVELAPIRVNVIQPGLVDTPFLDLFGERRNAIIAEYSKRLPVKRPGTARRNRRRGTVPDEKRIRHWNHADGGRRRRSDVDRNELLIQERTDEVRTNRIS